MDNRKRITRRIIMSSWTYINGIITVRPMGRTQPEKRYILDTVLEHLPYVPGSEGGMETYVVQRNGDDCSSSVDEFDMFTTYAKDNYGRREGDDNHGWFRTQSSYFIVVDASLRDTYFEDTLKNFMNWFCRLAKRIGVENVNVAITGHDADYNYKRFMFTDENGMMDGLEEKASWCNDTGEPAWAEYLMWDREKNGSMPITLKYKYVTDKKNDKEAERRINYQKR